METQPKIATREYLAADILRTYERRFYEDSAHSLVVQARIFLSMNNYEPWSNADLETLVNEVIPALGLRKKQEAMKARQDMAKACAATPSREKINGMFKVRRLRNYPSYTISENGAVVGPTGTVLKFRWDKDSVPYVRIDGKDRKVFWLLCEVGFQESSSDKKARRGKAKTYAGYNDEAEARAEDPEAFGNEGVE